jgi:hypothetical protein
MRKIVSLTSVVALLIAVAARGGEGKAPKPGPEIKKLNELVGTWDCMCEAKGKTSMGTMTYKMGLGGLWLLEQFQGEFEGKKFEGMGCMSYDSAKKNYVAVWIDSTSTTPMASEGNFDKSGKKMTMKGEMTMPDGKKIGTTMVTEMKDRDNMVMTMTCDLGEMMKISLKRQTK